MSKFAENCSAHKASHKCSTKCYNVFSLCNDACYRYAYVLRNTSINYIRNKRSYHATTKKNT